MQKAFPFNTRTHNRISAYDDKISISQHKKAKRAEILRLVSDKSVALFSPKPVINHEITAGLLTDDKAVKNTTQKTPSQIFRLNPMAYIFSHQTQ